MPKPSVLLIAALALLVGAATALGVVGCGGDDDDAANTAPIAVDEAETVDVTLAEYELNPDEVDVRAGVIEFVATNEGDENHALAIESSEGEVRRTKELEPGESDRVKLDLRPGTYAMYDPLGDNRARGMEGEVDVEPRTETNTVTDTNTQQQTETETETQTETDTRTQTETDTQTETQTETQQRTETVTVPRGGG